jgi:tRNA threonylcarbamoyladenosine biosynthesis protein TsaB
MIILAIETTGPLASVAILYDHNIIKESINHTHYSHLEEIVPMIKAILWEKGLKKDDITAIAVSRGPGSFTGIRIGMATAKALAQVWGKPIIEVPTLKSFAYGEKETNGFIICPIFDARRSQIYAAAYKREGDIVQTLIEEGAYEIEYFLNLLKEKNQAKEKIIFYGDGIEVYEEQINQYKGNFAFASDENRFQRASKVVLLGAELFHQGIVTDAFRAKPEYLRKSEAERKLLEKCENLK